MSDNTNQEAATQEQIEAYKKARDNRKKFYEEEIPFLKKEKEYTTLLAEIEEQRLKRLTMSIRGAQLAAGPVTEPDPDMEEDTTERRSEAAAQEADTSEKKEKKTRTLKKVD
jgi:hypothetical protein